MVGLDAALLGLTVLATSVMAASAVIQAVRFEFDFFGALFLGLVTAVGGGTLRDLLIGATPVFWIDDLTYLATAIPIGAITFLAIRRIEAGAGQRNRLLLYLDAIGLALFTLVGIDVALAHGLNPMVAVILGCITGVGGGMLRDILCGLTPILLKSDIYATLSLLGGAIYVLGAPYLGEELRLILAFAFISVTRVLVLIRQDRAGKITPRD